MGFAGKRCLVAALQLFLILVPTAVPGVLHLDENPDLPYLYDEDSGVVIEYMPSADVADPVRPAFIYSTNNGPRLVEFYVPWCPFCQTFRDHFVEVSGQMVEGARSVGVDMRVYAISCQVHKTLCRNWEMEVFPQLRLFKAGENINTGKTVYYKFFPNSILKHLQIDAFVDENLYKKKKLKNRRATAAAGTKNKLTRQEDIVSDAHVSFHFALRNSIFMADGPLPIKARVAFENWLNLLHRAIPVTSSLHLAVSALLDDFEFIVEDEEALMEIAFRFAPPKMKWSMACTHGTRGAGYSCGLWELFHIVTVGVTEWNELSLTDLSMAVGVEEAAVTIRNYVENFFGCDICRVNFMAAFDSCGHDRCNRLDNNATSVYEWRELPLWLFETHNSVNIRLLHEKGEREQFYPTPQDEMHKQWPARDDCPQCWHADGGWMGDHVVDKLKLDYWPEASASFLDQQRDFFNEKKMEVEAAKRFLVPAPKEKVGNENQEVNSMKAILDVQSELVKEMDGNEEKEANSEEAKVTIQNEAEEEMDDDVSRKDSFYDTEENDDKVAHSLLLQASVELLLFIIGIVGLLVTWYARKLQRKRSGLHKKRDVYR